MEGEGWEEASCRDSRQCPHWVIGVRILELKFDFGTSKPDRKTTLKVSPFQAVRSMLHSPFSRNSSPHFWLLFFRVITHCGMGFYPFTGRHYTLMVYLFIDLFVCAYSVSITPLATFHISDYFFFRVVTHCGVGFYPFIGRHYTLIMYLFIDLFVYACSVSIAPLATFHIFDYFFSR